MTFIGKCTKPGCGFVAKSPEKAECAAWLWQHICSCHKDLPDLKSVEATLVFNMDDDGVQGLPGSQYAREFKQPKAKAA